MAETGIASFCRVEKVDPRAAAAETRMMVKPAEEGNIAEVGLAEKGVDASTRRGREEAIKPDV